MDDNTEFNPAVEHMQLPSTADTFELPAPVVPSVSPIDQGTALTAQASDINAGYAGQLADLEAARRAAPLDAAVAAEDDTWLEKWSSAFNETGFAYLIEPLFGPDDDEWGFEKDFRPANHWADIRDSYGLPDDEETLAKFADTQSLSQMHFIATRMQQHEDNQRMLEHHGAYAFASGALDPAMWTVDLATFGATKALRLGRLASALAGATTVPMYMGATELAGKDVSGMEYFFAAALGGVSMAAFGGEAGRLFDLTRAQRQPSAWSEPGSIAAFTTEADRLMPNEAARNLIRDIIDDPLRREDVLSNENAASYFRLYHNELDGLYKQYSDELENAVREQVGKNWLGSKLDFDNTFHAARDAMERRIADILIQRDLYYQRFGTSMPAVFQGVEHRLADMYEQVMRRGGEMAKEAGLLGFEDFVPSSGYFHRAWNPESIARFTKTKAGKRFLRGLISEAALRGIRGLDVEEANLIANAIIQRAQARLTDESIDFMGMMGKADTAYLREMLESTKTSQAKIDSIMARLEQNVEEAGKVKYAKQRLPLDMSVSAMFNGQRVSMLDLIDTDLGRLAENYTQSIAGRSALAKVGIGGDTESIAALRRKYAHALLDLPEDVRKDRMLSFDGMISDFTGIRPESNILGLGAQRLKAMADSTMLAASGFWQTAEYMTMAHRYGLAETGKEFIKRFPGIGKIMRNMDDDLYEELRTTLNLDLARDVRVRAWTRQHEINLASRDRTIDRVLHTGKQLVPFLNGMKYVHANQARMNVNLALNKIVRAAHGDAEALRMIQQYGMRDTADVFNEIRSLVTVRGKNAQKMNWAAWDSKLRDQVMLTATRMMDDAVLFGRIGQGAGSPLIARSQVGQILGQFRSFVAFAHNKLLRGTYANEGVRGVAALVAYQYPLTVLLVMANEGRKGTLDTSEEGIKEAMFKAVGYTAGLGFAGDAFGILGFGGGRGGMSVPITSLFNAGPKIAGGVVKAAGGDFGDGAADIVSGAAMVTPAMMLIPGTGAAINAMKED